MRGSLNKSLKNVFEENFMKRFKHARPVRLSSGTPGSIAWLVGENDRTSAYVILVISPRDDKFTLEVAWSVNKRIPEHSGKIPGEEGTAGELRFRLSRLWQPSGFEVWYDLQHEEDYPNASSYSPSAPEADCLGRIPSKVERAIKALETHGIPYLKNVIASR